MGVDERAIIVQLRWVLWSQRARSRSTRYLQISRWQFEADSSIILEFIALRVKARGLKKYNATISIYINLIFCYVI